MKKLLLLYSLFLINYFGFGQINLSGGYTAQQLASYLAGPNITVYNATITGAATSFGEFTTGATSTNLGINSGVVLTTGGRNNVIGPNNSTGSYTDNGAPGDAQLTTLAGIQTYDACVLQFQFDVQSESVEFKYVFGSEEYPEFVNAGFNDVFAFYISGPGITGWQNIALIPNTTTPVTIDNINNNSYWQYYIDNTNGTSIQYDGFTRTLIAKKTGLTPCQTYTLRLAIADAGDGVYDSGVFLEAGSLKQGTVSAITQTVNADSVALEGCTNAKFIFSLDSAKSTDTQIDFEIAGSALNGVDYEHIDTLFIIPAGQTSATITIDAISDGIAEGIEDIYLIYTPYPCAPKDTVKLYINDYQNLIYENTVTNCSCFNSDDGIVDFTITGGSAPFTYYLKDSITGAVSTYTSNPATGVAPGTYYINVQDNYGCAAEDIVVGSQYNGGPVFLPDGTGQSYTTSLPISGFSAGATLQSVDQLQSICINMEHSRIGELEIKLQAPNGQQIILKQQPGGATCNMGEPCADGPADAGNTDTSPGIGYTYCFNANPTYGTMASEATGHTYTYTNICDGTTQSDKYLPAGSYASYNSLSGLIGAPLNGNWTLIITDNIPNNNGWVFDWSISFTADPPDSIVTITQPSHPTVTSTSVKPNCGATNGSINITVSGTSSPYSYLWSNGATTEDLSGIGAGGYTVTVTDVNSCIYNYPVLLSNNGTLALSTVISNATCSGANNGSIDLTVSGGTSPYTYLWSNAAISEDVSSLSSGTYSVNVTDGLGCQGLISASITQPTPINCTSSITNETCGNENGTIQLTVSGGTGPYTYLWSNGSTAEDPDFLQAGTYSVTITDANNCTKTSSFTLINEVASCGISCDVAISNSIITNEACGFGNGSINVSVVNGLQPFQYSWSNGAATQDINGLSAGTYSLTVLDSKNCTATQTFTVVNNSGTLNVTAAITASNCGNANGAINQTIAGGNLPYTISWSNGSYNEDLSSLLPGTYSVIVSDASGCSVSESYTVANNSSTLAQTYGNAMDEMCNNQTGSIDITISGGATPYMYQWSNGAVTQDLMNLHAGVYSCTVTASNGCKIYTPQYTINNNSGTLNIFDIDILDEVCGNGGGRLNVDITGGSTPYSYLWNTSQTTATINNLSSGNYSCLITDNNGCSVSTGNLTISNTAGTLSVTNVLVTNEMCNNHLGAVDVSISGGSAPINYVWSNGANTQDLSGLASGSYNCTLTDINGCSTTASAIVQNSNGSLSVANVLVTNETCGNANGAVDLTTSGGSGPVTYVWSNNTIGEDLSGLSAGSYSCQITDSLGCTISASATVINQTGNLSAAFTSVNENCNAHNGSINITVVGGTGPYNFQWSNGAVTEDLSGLSMGTYSCLITDANNCHYTTQVISINNTSGNMLIGTNAIVNENCGNAAGSIDASVSGGTSPYTYSWSNGSNTQDISGLTAGGYTLTTTDANGCSSVHSFTVQNSSGSFTYTGQVTTNEVCGQSNGTINISYTGGVAPVTFAWSNGAVTEDLSGLAAGTYSVNITDGNGCIIHSSNVIIQNLNSNLSASVSSSVDEVCGNNSGAISVSVNGGALPLTYLWSNGANTQNVSGLSAGSYSLTITDANGCSNSSVYATILNSSGTLAIASVVVSDEYCSNGNGAINVTVIGGTTPYTFVWSDGSVTEDLTNLSAAAYSCNITDANGCAQIINETISNIASTLNVTYLSNDEYCSNMNGSIDITVSGGLAPYSFVWSNGAITEDISNLTAGSYSCTITDGHGCTDAINTTLSNQASTLSLITEDIGDTHCGIDNGYINLGIGGGVSPLSFNWNNGSVTQNLTDLSAGSYSCTITDAEGCSMTYSTSVAPSALFSLTIDSVIDASCNQNNGSIGVTVNGGTSTVNYTWTEASSGYISSSEDLTSLTPGNYQVVCYDNSCIDSTAVTVANIIPYSVSGVTINASCPTCPDGMINVTSVANGDSLSYSWSPGGATTEDFSGLLPGTYTLTVNDAGNCQNVLTFTVGSNVGIVQNAITLSDWTVHPNPSTGIFVVDYLPASDFGQEIQVVNMLGEVILEYSISKITAETDGINLDLTKQANGVYYVRLKDGREAGVKKIVLSK